MAAAACRGRILIIGFGSVGQGVLPLLLRHIDIRPHQVLVVASDEAGMQVASACGVVHRTVTLTRQNYRRVLGRLLQAGDLLLNLSFGVSSLALIALCGEVGALYVDTSLELWGDEPYASRDALHATNYAMREQALEIGNASRATAIVGHGANPGLVSHLVKRALLSLARDCGLQRPEPRTKHHWAALAHALGVKVIQIVERDTQCAWPPKRIDEFVNTWSIESFAREMRQPPELGWGTHEGVFPVDGVSHRAGCQAGICLSACAARSRVRTWSPAAGPAEGHLVSHGESISIADFLTLGPQREPIYRPSVYFVYRPCEEARLSIEELGKRNWRLHATKRVIRDDVLDGGEELGVLLMGHARTGYWYGLELTIEEARRLAPYNNATSLQVAAAVLGAVLWAIHNPEAGVVEADEIPCEEVLGPCLSYAGEVRATYTDWTPTVQEPGRGNVDPWQFANFRLS